MQTKQIQPGYAGVTPEQRADYKSCGAEVGYFLLVVVVGYFLIRDAVTAGMLNAWKRQEQQKLKAAEKAERAAQAAAAAKRASRGP